MATGRQHARRTRRQRRLPGVADPAHPLRQRLLFAREFGRPSCDLFLPDCFGFGFALPSIAAHCGLLGLLRPEVRQLDGTRDDPVRHRPLGRSGRLGHRRRHPTRGLRRGPTGGPEPGPAVDRDGSTRRAGSAVPHVGLMYVGVGDRGGAPRCDVDATGSRRSVEASRTGAGPCRRLGPAVPRPRDGTDRDACPPHGGELLLPTHGTGLPDLPGAAQALEPPQRADGRGRRKGRRHRRLAGSAAVSRRERCATPGSASSGTRCTTTSPAPASRRPIDSPGTTSCWLSTSSRRC